MSSNISKASEAIAENKKLDLVLNKEACFYNNPKIDITELVINQMDKNFDKETAKNETENKDNSTASAEENQTPKVGLNDMPKRAS